MKSKLGHVEYLNLSFSPGLPRPHRFWGSSEFVLRGWSAGVVSRALASSGCCSILSTNPRTMCLGPRGNQAWMKASTLSPVPILELIRDDHLHILIVTEILQGPSDEVLSMSKFRCWIKRVHSIGHFTYPGFWNNTKTHSGHDVLNYQRISEYIHIWLSSLWENSEF